MIKTGEVVAVKDDWNSESSYYLLKIDKITDEGISADTFKVNRQEGISKECEFGFFPFDRIIWIREATKKEVELCKF